MEGGDRATKRRFLWGRGNRFEQRRGSERDLSEGVNPLWMLVMLLWRKIFELGLAFGSAVV